MSVIRDGRKVAPPLKRAAREAVSLEDGCFTWSRKVRRILTEVGDAEHAEYRVHSGRLRGSGHMGSRVGLEAVLHSVETNVHRI